MPHFIKLSLFFLISFLLTLQIVSVSSISDIPIQDNGEESNSGQVFSHCNFFPSSTPDPNYEHFRTFTFASQCNQDLYVNLQGYTWYENMQAQYQTLPEGGGFKLNAHTSKAFQVSERLYSGRVWARINCENRNGTLIGSAGDFVCDTQNCPLPVGTPIGGENPDVTCTMNVGGNGIFIGGVPPGPLAEMTLCGGQGSVPSCYSNSGSSNCNGPDYYDLSLVDGPGKISLSITQINGQDSGAGDYSCGNPKINSFDFKNCPLELRVGLKYDSNTKIWSYYNQASVNDAIGCVSACGYMSSYYSRSDPNFNYLQAHTCCTCGDGGGSCEQYCGGDGCQDNEYNPNCIAGCSPYAGYPDTSGWRETECFLDQMPIIDTGRSCSSSNDCFEGSSSLNPYTCNGRCQLNLGKIPNIFKTTSPQAYSWQFDDLSSTYLCYYPDYRIDFYC